MANYLSWPERRNYWKKNNQTVSPLFKIHKNSQGQELGYMTLPAGKVTLPNNAHLVQTKRLNTTNVKGEQSYELYCLYAGTKYSYTNKNGQHKTIQNWWVTKKVYYAGRPAVDEILYNGPEAGAAKHRFALIPYNEWRMYYPGENGTRTYKTWNSDGTVASVMQGLRTAANARKKSKSSK